MIIIIILLILPRLKPLTLHMEVKLSAIWFTPIVLTSNQCLATTVCPEKLFFSLDTLNKFIFKKTIVCDSLSHFAVSNRGQCLDRFPLILTWNFLLQVLKNITIQNVTIPWFHFLTVQLEALSFLQHDLISTSKQLHSPVSFPATQLKVWNRQQKFIILLLFLSNIHIFGVSECTRASSHGRAFVSCVRLWKARVSEKAF